MKKNNTQDYSTPYRNLGIGRVNAPKVQTGEPKASRITGKGDLRGGKRK